MRRPSRGGDTAPGAGDALEPLGAHAPTPGRGHLRRRLRRQPPQRPAHRQGQGHSHHGLRHQWHARRRHGVLVGPPRRAPEPSPRRCRPFALVLGEHTVRVRLGSKDFASDLDAVRRRLLPHSVAEIRGALDAVSSRWSVSSHAVANARPMTPAELGQLAADDLVTMRRRHHRSPAIARATGRGAAPHRHRLPARSGRGIGPDRHPLRLPLRRRRRFRRHLGRCRARRRLRHRLYDAARHHLAGDGPAPPSSPARHELGLLPVSGARMQRWKLA